MKSNCRPRQTLLHVSNNLKLLSLFVESICHCRVALDGQILINRENLLQMTKEAN